MVCSKCGGKAFLDRTFSDNKSYETSCVICGDRKFIDKNTELGTWISRMEALRRRTNDLAL